MWSNWSPFSPCTCSYGGGIQAQSRVCNKRPIVHGGPGCPGNSTRIQACNTQPCTASMKCEDSNSCYTLYILVKISSYIHTYTYIILYLTTVKSSVQYNKILTVVFTYKIELLTVFHDCRVGIRFESKFVYLSLKA